MDKGHVLRGLSCNKETTSEGMKGPHLRIGIVIVYLELAPWKLFP
jgi:hypothetical protein